MKCVTLWQPWAGAVVMAGKDVENRTWPTRFRGPLLIHAGRRIERDPLIQRHLGGLELARPQGAILGLTELRGCSRITDCQLPWATGPWCWLLGPPEHVLIFREPVPWRGAQGLFEVPDDAIRPHLERAETLADRQRRQWHEHHDAELGTRPEWAAEVLDPRTLPDPRKFLHRR